MVVDIRTNSDCGNMEAWNRIRWAIWRSTFHRVVLAALLLIYENGNVHKKLGTAQGRVPINYDGLGLLASYVGEPMLLFVAGLVT